MRLRGPVPLLGSVTQPWCLPRRSKHHADGIDSRLVRTIEGGLRLPCTRRLTGGEGASEAAVLDCGSAG